MNQRKRIGVWIGWVALMALSVTLAHGKDDGYAGVRESVQAELAKTGATIPELIPALADEKRRAIETDVWRMLLLRPGDTEVLALQAKLAIAARHWPRALKAHAEASGKLKDVTVFHQQFVGWLDTVDAKNEDRVVAPNAIAAPLAAAFDGWIVAEIEFLTHAIQVMDHYPDESARKAAVGILAKHCSDVIGVEALAEFPELESRLIYLHGRLYAAAGELGRMDEVFADLAKRGDGDPFSVSVLRQMYVDRIAAAFLTVDRSSRNFGLVHEIYRGLRAEPFEATYFNDDIGRESLFRIAIAMIQMPAATSTEGQEALRLLQRAASADGMPPEWKSRFILAMGDVWLEAAKSGIRLKAQPSAWLNIARGVAIRARREYNPDPYREPGLFVDAAQCYRLGILASKRFETETAERLAVEPRLWLELGELNARYGNLAMASATFQSLRDRFSPANRGAYLKAKVADSIPELDDPKSGVLAVAAAWQSHALESLARQQMKDTEWASKGTVEWRQREIARLERAAGSLDAGRGIPILAEPPEPAIAPEVLGMWPVASHAFLRLEKTGSIEHWKSSVSDRILIVRDDRKDSRHFLNRSSGGRRLMAKRHGGSKRTEAAVDSALRWLAQHQEPDGHWDAMKYQSGQKTDTAVTALALLAFLGAGHSEKMGEWKDNVRRAVAWLRSKQAADGAIFDVTDAGGHRGGGYPVAIATLALAEAAAMDGSAETKKAAQLAIDYCCDIHQQGDENDRLGWRYAKKTEGDMSVSGWHISALVSAKKAGLRVPAASLSGAIGFLNSVEHPVEAQQNVPQTTCFWYMLANPHEHTQHRLTAIGNYCRLELGTTREDRQTSVDWFVAKGGLPVWGANGDSVDLYYWYYGALAAFQMQGKVWESWNAALVKALVENQGTNGDDAGSWNPVGAYSSEWGRVGQTALGALCLETYYRYPVR